MRERMPWLAGALTGTFAAGFVVGWAAAHLLRMFIINYGGTSGPAPAVPYATFDQPVRSPSGNYLLTMYTAYDGEGHFCRFDVTTAGRETPRRVVFVPVDRFPLERHPYFLWDECNRIWAYCPETRTVFWVEQDDGTWAKHHYPHDQIPAPPFLKKANPERHPA